MESGPLIVDYLVKWCAFFFHSDIAVIIPDEIGQKPYFWMWKQCGISHHRLACFMSFHIQTKCINNDMMVRRSSSLSSCCQHLCDVEVVSFDDDDDDDDDDADNNQSKSKVDKT